MQIYSWGPGYLVFKSTAYQLPFSWGWGAQSGQGATVLLHPLNFFCSLTPPEFLENGYIFVWDDCHQGDSSRCVQADIKQIHGLTHIPLTSVVWLLSAGTLLYKPLKLLWCKCGIFFGSWGNGGSRLEAPLVAGRVHCLKGLQPGSTRGVSFGLSFTLPSSCVCGPGVSLHYHPIATAIAFCLQVMMGKQRQKQTNKQTKKNKKQTKKHTDSVQVGPWMLRRAGIVPLDRRVPESRSPSCVSDVWWEQSVAAHLAITNSLFCCNLVDWIRWKCWL